MLTAPMGTRVDPSTYTELRWSSNPLDAQAGYIAEFQVYDERLILDDNDTDGHKVRGVLTVEGQGTAAFVGTGVRDLNYPEGKSYWLQVCINGTSTCSDVFRGTT